MMLPRSRGPFTELLIEALRGTHCSAVPAAPDSWPRDAIADEELQLALWICYELHYRGFADVAPEWEWQPELLALRRSLEQRLLAALRRDVVSAADEGNVPERLRKLVDTDDGPQLARFIQRRASRQQFMEFVMHRSVYHLKEADPHSWAIPRLSGRAKAALLEIQTDEYGRGNLAQMHSELFRATLRGMDLNDSYGYYVDVVPAVTLAVSNLMSIFGLHRALRGALAGHLAAFEMTSSFPNRQYGQGLRRLGGNEASRRFYDEHVTADALHEQLAAYDLCGSLVAEEPDLAEDVIFGAAACLHVDARFAEHLLRCWEAGETSLHHYAAFSLATSADI
ncbi:MAG: iron-containing redox enzyme family protein [Actinomycetota bacterium]|nr:iron-containing redox enzyme family protein [Actinomycetota bacterium]